MKIAGVFLDSGLPKGANSTAKGIYPTVTEEKLRNWARSNYIVGDAVHVPYQKGVSISTDYLSNGHTWEIERFYPHTVLCHDIHSPSMKTTFQYYDFYLHATHQKMINKPWTYKFPQEFYEEDIQDYRV